MRSELLICSILVISLMGLAGCATTSEIMQRSEIGYEKFYDSQGDYKLVGRNNDIYLEKLDGSESRRITHTPDAKEYYAFFTAEGEYIIYSDRKPKKPAEAFSNGYSIRKDKDDTNKTPITKEAVWDMYLTALKKRPLSFIENE